MPTTEWVKRYSAGKTFADVGGLWGTINEKVTVAAKAGASAVTMIDTLGKHEIWWEKLDQRCEAEGVKPYSAIMANIDSPDIFQTTGTFDVVHSNGVLYHCPNPIHTISQLAKLTRDILIIGSSIIPCQISNSKGSISLENSSALLVPALTDSQKEIITQHFVEAGGNFLAAGINHHVDDWDPAKTYGNWWYLFTDGFIEGLLKVHRLRILETADGWNGRIKCYLTQKE
jgi:2-polyprenyl-3-methyl-5-hydroxy-6-metoxy-1,4-benzoquinol methylase